MSSAHRRLFSAMAAALALLCFGACGGGSSGAATPAGATPRPVPTAAELSRDVGQLLIGTYPGTSPPAAVLAAVRAGRIGGVILTGENTDTTASRVRAAVASLQAAARSGANPGLLVMTDQEGGEVNRLNGPPTTSAAGMGDAPSTISAQALATAQLLTRAGVNVDLAPVADVASPGGFIALEHRGFASTPARVARAACSFAAGLVRGGVADTLKHFPGLGSAIDSTDDGPVTLNASAAQIQRDTAAYRDCGSGPRSLVMISSASYPDAIGRLPAVLSPATYQRLLPADGVHAVTISDAMDTPAFARLPHPALTALSAGLDLLLYTKSQANALGSQRALLSALRAGRLSPAVIQRADRAVATLKRNLGLG